MASKPAQNIVYLSLFLLFVLGFVWVQYAELRETMTLYAGLLVLSIVIYSRKELQGDLPGITRKTFFSSVIVGAIGGGIFYYASALIPGFSITIPVAPQSIGTGLRSFVVNFVAPFVETIFVQGAFFGFTENRLGKKKAFIAIILASVFFASLHLAAYVSGFYSYPDLGSGLLALGANISAFITAFLFGFVAQFTQFKFHKDLGYVIAFHTVINFLVFTTLSFAQVSY